MCIKDRIERLRQKMEKHHISVYMIPTADYHQSEYVGEHFKSRAFITGFTGSAGTAVITKEESCLWTDGRYFLQAESQLQGSGIRLQKMGEPGVPVSLPRSHQSDHSHSTPVRASLSRSLRTVLLL